jgi:hypothetical protein
MDNKELKTTYIEGTTLSELLTKINEEFQKCEYEACRVAHIFMQYNLEYMIYQADIYYTVED